MTLRFHLINLLSKRLQNYLLKRVVVYYFKIIKKFFAPHLFYKQDINYVSRQLKVVDFAATSFELDRFSVKRYKEKILDHFGYTNFNEAAQQLLEHKILSLTQSYIRPKVIFNDCVALLLFQKIEVPKYNSFSDLIIKIMRDYTSSMLQQLELILTPEQRILLDELLSLADDKSIYKLTSLKSYNHSLRPKSIRENADGLYGIQELYYKVLPIVKKLSLSTRGVEYFATTVLKSDIFRVKRKRTIDRYLHLITFVVYQYSILNDALMEMFLKSMASFNSSVKREHKNQCYNNKELYAVNIQQANDQNSKQIELINNLFSLCKSKMGNYYIKYTVIESVINDFLENNQSMLDNDNLKKIEEELRDSGFYSIISDKSRSLQAKLSPIVNVLKFDHTTNTSNALLEAINKFQNKEGKISSSAPIQFLDPKEKKQVKADNKFNITLYKALLFRQMSDHIKSGSLNLESSYKFLALDEYLIPSNEWKNNKASLIKQAALELFEDVDKILSKLETELDDDYININECADNNENPYLSISAQNKYTITTPKVEKPNEESSEYFPDPYTVPMQEVLTTVDQFSNFTKCFEHIKYNKQSSIKHLIAGIMSLGYGMRHTEIATISKDISRSALDNTINWCFTIDNIQNATDSILKLTKETAIPDLFLGNNQKIHTSSDGQKWKVSQESLTASYSFKYYGQEQGVTVNSFIDRRNLPFYSTVISSSIREASYIIDGLLHNEIVQSDIHSTDTHGYTETIFAITHFLSIYFAPRIKKVNKQIKSMFAGYRAKYKKKKYKIIPTHTINKKVIKEMYDEVLRFMVTIKLKRSTASQLLSRLNSYSKQHKLYHALKEFGKIIKSKFILRYLNELELRQSIEKQLSLVELNNKFSKAIAQENNKSFVQQLQTDQIIAESCRRLMKAAIICWNCLILHNKIDKAESKEEVETIIRIVKSGTLMKWKHINFRGLYDFSEETTKDQFNLKLHTLNPLQYA